MNDMCSLVWCSPEDSCEHNTAMRLTESLVDILKTFCASPPQREDEAPMLRSYAEHRLSTWRLERGLKTFAPVLLREKMKPRSCARMQNIACQLGALNVAPDASARSLVRGLEPDHCARTLCDGCTDVVRERFSLRQSWPLQCET